MSSQPSPLNTTHEDDDQEGAFVSSAAPHPRIKIENSPDKVSADKFKDFEVSVPIVYGTVAFWLGRKATDSQSHKWTVYVRGATNEDLGIVIKRVVFHLHPTFNNPNRVVDSSPFELSEYGWGEFEIAITLYFHSDVCDKQLDLYHNLKLYPAEESGPQSIKKPVVMESYNEIVFPNPSEAFFARVQNHPAVIVPRLPASFQLSSFVGGQDFDSRKKGHTKDNPLSQWFKNFSEADELLKLAAARQQFSLPSGQGIYLPDLGCVDIPDKPMLEYRYCLRYRYKHILQCLGGD